MNASHSINLFTNSRHPISTNSKAPPHTYKPTITTIPLFARSHEGLTLGTSAFQIFHGGYSTFINSFDTTNFHLYSQLTMNVGYPKHVLQTQKYVILLENYFMSATSSQI